MEKLWRGSVPSEEDKWEPAFDRNHSYHVWHSDDRRFYSFKTNLIQTQNTESVSDVSSDCTSTCFIRLGERRQQRSRGVNRFALHQSSPFAVALHVVFGHSGGRTQGRHLVQHGVIWGLTKQGHKQSYTETCSTLPLQRRKKGMHC